MKSPVDLAQTIAGLHPPVGLRYVTDTPSGQNYVTGAWQADRCPRWIAEIAALISARDAEIMDQISELVIAGSDE